MSAFVDLFRVLSSFKKNMEGSKQGSNAFRKKNSDARRIIQTREGFKSEIGTVCGCR